MTPIPSQTPGVIEKTIEDITIKIKDTWQGKIDDFTNSGLPSVLHWINFIIVILFVICYAHQFFYLLVPFICKKRKLKNPPKNNNFAILISARNESVVIKDLLDSIKKQTYNLGSITTFVIADNCTDSTAEICRKEGAVVYERFNKELVGKGYALNELLGHISKDFPDGFDGYFVFDADNVLAPNYIEEMNKTFSDDNDVVTGYRNSKNFGSNWVSSGYALWFIRESRFLNYSRYTVGASCAISGTGFMFSRAVLDSLSGGWPYHLLTEDIEFTVDQVIKGRKIAFCETAEVFDEQPIKFSQSWKQRMRWSRGYLQVFMKHGKDMIKGVFKGSYSCYDMAMVIMPAYFLSTITVLCNLLLMILQIIKEPSSVAFPLSVNPLWQFAQMIIIQYGLFLLVGTFTTIVEWKHIHTSTAKKILFNFTFPLFMLTYVPLSLCALFIKATWKPIEHTMSLEEMSKHGEHL